MARSSAGRGERTVAPRAARPRALGIPRGWAAAVGIGLLVVLAGVVWAGVTSPRQASVPTSPPVGEGSAPDFTARLLGGGEFRLSQQQGKPVLVLFTASWCFDCIPEVDKLARLQEQFGPRGLQQLVLSVDPGDTETDCAGLRQHTNGPNLQWGLDSGQKATLAYKVRATDTKVLVDGRGQVVYRSVGATPFETLRDRVAALLG